jgi:hypothetical protein
MFDDAMWSDPKLAIAPEHDGRHQLAHRPLARESSAYIAILPDEQIAFFTYTWANQQGEAGAKIAVFGPGMGGQPIEAKLPERTVPAEMDFDRWVLDGFSMEQDLKFDKARIRWESSEVTLQYEFESTHPPYSYASDPRGCPSYCADDRIEQSSRIIGRLAFRDRVIDFDTTGHRDHSWGTRDWMAMQHYHWYLGQVGNDTAVHFWNLQALGENQLRGYVFKDGLMALVDQVDIHVDYDPDYWQRAYTAKLRDSAGRLTTIETMVFGRHPLISDPRMRLHESAGHSTIDGKRGVSWLECAWPKDYLEHIRANGPYESAKRST